LLVRLTVRGRLVAGRLGTGRLQTGTRRRAADPLVHQFLDTEPVIARVGARSPDIAVTLAVVEGAAHTARRTAAPGWMVKRREIGMLGRVCLKGHGPSVESDLLGLSSRVHCAAPSLQMQPAEPVVARCGATKTATLTVLQRLRAFLHERFLHARSHFPFALFFAHFVGPHLSSQPAATEGSCATRRRSSRWRRCIGGRRCACRSTLQIDATSQVRSLVIIT